MLPGVKYLHLSPLRLDVRRLCNTRQPFVALVQLWGSHRLSSAYMEIMYIVLIKGTIKMLLVYESDAADLWLQEVEASSLVHHFLSRSHA